MGWIILGIMIFIIFIIRDKGLNEKSESNQNSRVQQIKNRFDIPNDVLSADYDNTTLTNSELTKIMNGTILPKTKGFYIWENGGSISIVDKPDNLNLIKDATFDSVFNNIKKIAVPIGNIEYYHLTGQKIAVTTGSGGGTSLTGAIIGNEIAGVGGAIIGGKKGVEINTEIVDDRSVILVYRNDSDSVINHMQLPPSSYNVLLRLIPDKEIEYIKSRIK